MNPDGDILAADLGNKEVLPVENGLQLYEEMMSGIVNKAKPYHIRSKV